MSVDGEEDMEIVLSVRSRNFRRPAVVGIPLRRYEHCAILWSWLRWPLNRTPSRLRLKNVDILPFASSRNGSKCDSVVIYGGL